MLGGGYTANNANNLSKEIYNSKIRLIYFSNYSEADKALHLNTFDKDITLYTGESRIYLFHAL